MELLFFSLFGDGGAAERATEVDEHGLEETFCAENVVAVGL